MEGEIFVKKRILTLLMAAVMLLSVTGTTFASAPIESLPNSPEEAQSDVPSDIQDEGGIQPYTNRLTGSLNFDGRIARCSGLLIEHGATLRLTMTLKRGTQTLKSWTATGTDYVGIGEEYAVTSHATYTLVFEYWVNGVKQPNIKTSKSTPY